ncbi:MAG: proline--tRNA ligase [Chloroflexi bacterium]|jgi:prolyl-tRNA synthetase|nr:proline--tRNA ligase [Chloroflexota bacterium]MBT4141661.1 proline--tRNA ligase [Chloroflexota bacterium]MBT4341331.1 proline--tRNA ligase [Chloroflexota bacterium]MBT5253603.1 proline--tRNA ligase [Chloroflexota bacterium]MBT5477307.1 proline--tRNA ligase [Chloroflexota bacterium]
MRSSQLFGKTLRQAPGDAETISHKLLTRAGFIQQIAAGIFSLQPLGNRSITKIRNIIREEMDRAGGQEINMPVVQPRSLWEESGRAETFVPPLATFEDKRERQMIIAPTHEETATAMARAGVTSYRDLPFTIYQIQTKFRDETRPRGGLLRVREFEMKDAYSFDADEEGMDRSFQAMVAAYRRIFKRCGLDVIMVDADSGGIGGKDSNEFVLLTDSGEDTILMSTESDYAANVEKASFIKKEFPIGELGEVEEFATPGIKTIEELAKTEGVSKSKTAKAVFYSVDGEIVVVTIRGDYEVNETKLRNLLDGAEPKLATAEEVKAAGLVSGSASAVGLTGMKSVVDDSITMGSNYLAGANKDGFHLRNVNFDRDFKADIVADIAEAKKGYLSPDGKGKLVAKRGIEIGHVFKLGNVYSSKMGANYTNEDGELEEILMGCYGIGVGRMLAAAVEANHDDLGMLLPRAIAPYEIYLAGLNLNDLDIARKAEMIYEQLQDGGYEVLFDDRDAPPGVKFKDADLLGIPARVVISSRSLEGGGVEVKSRSSKASEIVAESDVLETVNALFE